MSNTFSRLTIDPKHLYLEIAQTFQIAGDSYSTAGARQRALTNQLCLNAFLPWLREEFTSSARVYPHTMALTSFWEVVNGTAITFDNSRLVLVPTLAIDLNELRVPQEWVDIPDWVADYYIAVQVNPDDGWMRIFGYTTHQRLKTMGVYDAGDRTYSLEIEDLIPDLNVLWIAQQYPQETLQAAVCTLPSLPTSQANNLLERLGNPTVVFPRLEVPFQLWGALLTHSGWRQQLYERRQGLPQQWSIPQWFQSRVSNFAQQLGWEKGEYIAVGSRMRSQDIILSLFRQLVIVNNTYKLRVFPIGNLEERIWRFELRSATPGSLIPIGFKLRLLTEDLQPFDNNEDTATTAIELLYVEVMLEPGEGLVWEIEPAPEDWEREILQF
ncbi:MAG: DUF1822 family protein [Stigonema ocellatum SAG 48.90 = DSM 106950]|nr:DUF1822 family protein [Stigonema ocellatum SAG 48.90 = DSM 106950]